MENNVLHNEQDESNDIPRVRTFQSDIADAIKNKQGSVIKIAVAEQERKLEEGTQVTQVKKINTLYIFGSIILLVGVGVVGFIFWQKNKSSVVTLPSTVSKNTTFVKADMAVEFNTMGKENIYQDINTLFTTKEISVGQTMQVIFTDIDTQKNKKILSLDELLTKLSLSLPDNLVRSLDQNQYMIGVYQEKEPGRFILLRTTAFGNTFAATLEWEKTLTQDLNQLLDIHKNPGDEPIFKDKIIKNEDTRILYDTDGNAIVGYTFFGPKKELLLIAKDEATLGTLIERFTEKKVRQ